MTKIPSKLVRLDIRSDMGSQRQKHKLRSFKSVVQFRSSYLPLNVGIVALDGWISKLRHVIRNSFLGKRLNSLQCSHSSPSTHPNPTKLYSTVNMAAAVCLAIQEGLKSSTACQSSLGSCR